MRIRASGTKAIAQVAGHREGRHDGNDRHHHHQFDQREAARMAIEARETRTHVVILRQDRRRQIASSMLSTLSLPLSFKPGTSTLPPPTGLTSGIVPEVVAGLSTRPPTTAVSLPPLHALTLGVERPPPEPPVVAFTTISAPLTPLAAHGSLPPGIKVWIT